MMSSQVVDLAVAHRTFSIERVYPHGAERVFRAFVRPEIKRRWFFEGEGWDIEEYSADFRVGGEEISHFRFQGGPLMLNQTRYLDIVPERRMVFSYTMVFDAKPLSVSLATIELIPEGNETRLIYTEQGAYFGSEDQVSGREQGCRELFEKLAAELEQFGNDDRDGQEGHASDK